MRCPAHVRIAGRLLPSLTGPLNAFVADFIDTQVNGFVSSEAFSQVWDVALRTTHTQFVALISGDRGRHAHPRQRGGSSCSSGRSSRPSSNASSPTASRSPNGSPPVTTAIDLVQLNPQRVAQAQAGYRMLSVVAEWLPWLLLLLPTLALFLARDLRRTVIACGAAVAVGIVVAWLAFRAVVGEGMGVAAANGISSDAVSAITDGALGPMRGPALALGVLGLVVAFLGWLTARTTAS